MQDATLCFVYKGDPPREILLGWKKNGFGQGKYGGFGGKVEPHETIEAAAVRELEEESGIKTSQEALDEVAQLTFTFPAKPAWDQRVHVFMVASWRGEPTESVEMYPAWFEINELPYENMWQDSLYWLPLILAGKKLNAKFSFRPDNEGVEWWEIEEL